MKATLVRIGNSRGIRIPKALLEQCNLDQSLAVDLAVEQGHLVIRALARPRQGWEEAFRQMAAAGDDTLLDGDASTTAWDQSEWEW